MDPVELLRALIRFDTTNPPGGEAECVAYVRDLLDSAGCSTTVYAARPARPNLIARLPGEDSSSTILLQGHVDVVPTGGQEWTHPPFEGRLEQGEVWGRGALDMKGGVAMMLAAVLRASSEGIRPAHDVLFAVLCDEEQGGQLGARFLVEQHSELFEGVRYGIGEFGGFSMTIGEQRFYPIQVAEKSTCRFRAVVRGPGGHGALISRGGTMARLGRLLGDLGRRQLPIHVTPVVRQMLEAMIAALPRRRGIALRALLRPALAARAVERLGMLATLFEPMLRNTVTATVVHAGDKENVIPSRAEVTLDARALPGFTASELADEIHDLVGRDIELELLRDDPGPPTPDLARLETLAEILSELDPSGIPVPLLQIGATDARHFARLGIQTYGFVPLRLPEDFHFLRLVHAADERVPADAIRFGAEAVFRAIQRL